MNDLSMIESVLAWVGIPTAFILLAFYTWNHTRQLSFLGLLVLGEIGLYVTSLQIQTATPEQLRNDIYYFKLVSVDFSHFLIISTILFSTALKYRAGLSNDNAGTPALIFGLYAIFCGICIVCNATQGIYDFIFSSPHMNFVPEISYNAAVSWKGLYDNGINSLVRCKWLLLSSLPMIGGYQSFRDWLDGSFGSRGSDKNAGNSV